MALQMLSGVFYDRASPGVPRGFPSLRPKQSSPAITGTIISNDQAPSSARLGATPASLPVWDDKDEIQTDSHKCSQDSNVSNVVVVKPHEK